MTTKNVTNNVTSTVKLILHKDLILNTPNRQEKSEKSGGRKKLHMEKHHEGSNILFLKSGVCSKSLQVCVAFFTICGELAFGKILNI